MYQKRRFILVRKDHVDKFAIECNKYRRARFLRLTLVIALILIIDATGGVTIASSVLMIYLASPDLAPSDYFIFQNLEKGLRGRHFVGDKSALN